MTDSVVVEGYVKIRDGKKWKTRWIVLRKPSPVADCLVLLVFKDKSDKVQGHKERGSVILEDICGLETGQWFEGVGHTLAILCLCQAAVLGFDSKEALLAWDVRIRYSLGEVHRFNVGVLPGTKLESGPATLHLCNNLLALARDVPPLIIGHWNLPDLRRYGPVPNGFVFEGGTRCGYWAGVFFLASAESEQISFLFDCIVRGISPTRGPFGVRPILPDPSGSQAYSEERANHEAQELEKRLSLLSHQSSTVSSTYGPSTGGDDDRSISGSSDTSDTSHSDCSIGSRLAIWTETATLPNPSENTGQSRVPQQSIDKLSVNQGGGHRPVVKHPRQLQEIGRQSSSDSGIATGSHSSYSGSFSSYTGSLDIAQGEDFGSVFSLPPHFAADVSPCTCPPAPGHEYQVPTSLRYVYDTPRNVLQEEGGAAKDNEPSTSVKDNAALSTLSLESSEGHKRDSSISEARLEAAEMQSTAEPSQSCTEEDRKVKVAPSSDSQHPDACQICSTVTVTTASKTIFAICSTCGGFKATPHAAPGGPAIPAVPDQIDKWPCRPNASVGYDNVFTVQKTPEADASPAPEAFLSSETPKRKEEEAAPPRKGREKLAGLLADLLGCPSTERGPEAKNKRLNLYESMSSAFGDELKSKSWVTDTHAARSHPGKRNAIYENCLKCKGDHCHPPPPVPPAKSYNSGSSLPSGEKACTDPGRAMPSGPFLEKRLAHEAAANEEPHVRSCAAWGEDGEGHYEEMSGHSVTGKEKRLNSKEERRKIHPAYEVMESRVREKNSETEEKTKYEFIDSCGHQRFPQETEGAVFVFPPEAPVSERSRGDGVTYVNIPVSPTSKKQINYMELELQEPGPGIRATGTHVPAQRKRSTKYAQIDITATETAHKVGTQHALGREEGLHTLDLRRRGAPPQ